MSELRFIRLWSFHQAVMRRYQVFTPMNMARFTHQYFRYLERTPS